VQGRFVVELEVRFGWRAFEVEDQLRVLGQFVIEMKSKFEEVGERVSEGFLVFLPLVLLENVDQ
jgi:hypothetical protein